MGRNREGDVVSVERKTHENIDGFPDLGFKGETWRVLSIR